MFKNVITFKDLNCISSSTISSTISLTIVSFLSKPLRSATVSFAFCKIIFNYTSLNVMTTTFRDYRD